MKDHCTTCQLKYQRESGFYLGAIYFNYGLTALVVTIAYPVLFFTRLVQPQVLVAACLAFVVLFPLWFFRYARALWLGMDQFIDPQPLEQSSRK